jgi:hypothetical protein
MPVGGSWHCLCIILMLPMLLGKGASCGALRPGDPDRCVAPALHQLSAASGKVWQLVANGTLIGHDGWAPAVPAPPRSANWRICMGKHHLGCVRVCVAHVSVRVAMFDH